MADGVARVSEDADGSSKLSALAAALGTALGTALVAARGDVDLDLVLVDFFRVVLDLDFLKVVTSGHFVQSPALASEYSPSSQSSGLPQPYGHLKPSSQHLPVP